MLKNTSVFTSSRYSLKISPQMVVFSMVSMVAAAAVVTVPDVAFATVPVDGNPGFQQAAFEVYDLLDNWVGTTIGITTAGLGLLGMVTGFRSGVAAGAVGTGVGVAVLPDIMVGLSGGMVI